MIRIALGLFFVAGIIVLAISLQGNAGDASLTWLGWQVSTTAAAGVLLIGLCALLATIFWQVLVWVLQAPARASRAAAAARRRQGTEALTRGFVAAAAGDGPEARRQAARAADLAQDSAQLVRLLAAQAAEAAGDTVAARAAYTAMLGFADMRLAAHRGLLQAAVAEGDGAGATRHAQAAFDLDRTAPWAWRTLLQNRLDGADWVGALALCDRAKDRKVITPLVAERAKAALQTADAAMRNKNAAAIDLAVAAAKSRPDFTPATLIAVAGLVADGRGSRASGLIETAWRASAHPALWLAYRDLRTDETPKARSLRLAALAAMNPGDREARILCVELALIAGDTAAASTAVKALETEALTQRLARLHARMAAAAGQIDEARAWVARGALAMRELDWSDIGPGGVAFAYSAADWARAVIVYAESGELIHPRHERAEAASDDLPQIPSAYVDSAPFIDAAAAGDPFPPFVDDSDFGDALQPAGAEVRRSRGFLGLGKGR